EAVQGGGVPRERLRQSPVEQRRRGRRVRGEEGGDGELPGAERPAQAGGDGRVLHLRGELVVGGTGATGRALRSRCARVEHRLDLRLEGDGLLPQELGERLRRIDDAVEHDGARVAREQREVAQAELGAVRRAVV